MKKFNLSMFDSIKNALASTQSQDKGQFSNILQIEKGNTYLVRLLPNINDPEKTFFHYLVVGWESFSTGQYVQAVSPQTFGQRDPILEHRYKLYKHGTDDEKEKVKAIKRGDKWLVNVYVVEDSKNPDNNGTVKLLRYGKQIDKIIRRAIDGEDSDEFGARIFDLGSDGVNLKLQVEEQGGFSTYVSSRFTTAKANLGLSDQRKDEIYNSIVTSLDEVFPVKSTEELEAMYNDHFLCKESASSAPAKKESVPAKKEPVSDNVPASSDDDDVDPVVAELLRGIE